MTRDGVAMWRDGLSASLVGLLLPSLLLLVVSSSPVCHAWTTTTTTTRMGGRSGRTSTVPRSPLLQSGPKSSVYAAASSTTLLYVSASAPGRNETMTFEPTTTTTSVGAATPPTVAATATTTTFPLQLPLVQLALAGAITTFFTDILMHPMDTIKTVQQASVGVLTPDSAAGLTLVEAATQLWATHGLYAGFLTYATADAVSGSLKFAVWEGVQGLWNEQWVAAAVAAQREQSRDDDHGASGLSVSINDKDDDVPQPWMYALMATVTSAAAACVASSVTLVPGELLKNRQQVSGIVALSSSGASSTSSTMLDASVPLWQSILDIYHSSGLTGFYAGLDAVLVRDVPYTVLELGLYQLCKRLVVDAAAAAKQQQRDKEYDASCNAGISPTSEVAIDGNHNDNSTPSLEILAAAVTGAVTAVLTTPLDTIKCKLMVDPAFADLGVWQGLATMVHDDGVGAVFGGVWARVAWIVPFTAVYLPSYDALKRLLLERHVQHVEKQQEEDRRENDSVMSL